MVWNGSWLEVSGVLVNKMWCEVRKSRVKTMMMFFAGDRVLHRDSQSEEISNLVESINERATVVIVES